MNAKHSYPYLFICDRNLEKLHQIRLDRLRNVEDIIDDALYFNAVGILSNYKNPFTAKFKRTRKDANPQESELITLADRPKRLDTKELIDFLVTIQARGKDKKKRCVHQNSIQNLKKATEWTSQTSPRKPCLISNDQILEAIRLKGSGFSWKTLSEKLEINLNSLRSAISRFKLRNKDVADGVEGGSQIYREYQAKNNDENIDLRG